MTTERYLPEPWTLPAIDEHNEAYFTSGALQLEHCVACGQVQHPPSGVCIACQSVETDRVTAEPVGAVVSTTVVHHALNPMLKDHVPYNVVIVELRDHPHVRIVGNVLEVPNPPIGLEVVGSWTPPLGDRGVRLLQWQASG